MPIPPLNFSFGSGASATGYSDAPDSIKFGDFSVGGGDVLKYALIGIGVVALVWILRK